MLSTKTLRHRLTKLSVINYPLTWVQHRGLNSSDVFIASYPRAGSTWLRFMLFEILTGQSADFESVDRTIAGVRNHFNAPVLLGENGRFLQTHEPYRHEYKKAIYLVRDVRDVVISEYYFSKRLQFHQGDFASFFNKFVRGQANRYGFWADHVNTWLDAWEQDETKILLIRFEEMRQDPKNALLKMLSFLEVERSPTIVQQAVDNNTVKRMQEKEDKSAKFRNNADNIRFVNKGSIGEGQQFLSTEQLAHIEQCTQKARQRLAY